MTSLIIILGILLVFWYLNKISKNDYFLNPKQEDYELIKTLYSNFDWDFSNFNRAWKYFTLHPKQYNGTSVINDRFMVKGLEPMSVEHDLDFILAKSFIDLYTANIRYCKKLRDTNANWFFVWGFIFCGLTIVAIFKSVKYIKF